ncbi:MAG TPA: hypothetical protein VFV33_11085 [Gemmatimonadaceae bacterium]|nr:hypothetical protein [Gemmatimonadaceae bacterium]
MRTSRQLAVALALCSVLVSAQGCHRGMRQAPEAGPVALSIRNNAFFDVNVWALPTMGITPRVRLATVGGNSRVQLSVQPSSLRAGGVLVLYLHAIGTRYYWTSPPVMVSPDLVACLDIQSNPDGNLTRSTLYTLPKDVTTDDAAKQATLGVASRGASAAVAVRECGG